MNRYSTLRLEELLKTLSPNQIGMMELAGEPIRAKLTAAPGNGLPFGGIKVSDTGAIAAAVCLWLGGLDWPAGPPASGAEAARPQMRTFPVKTRILAFLVLLSLLLLFALELWKILELWLH